VRDAPARPVDCEPNAAPELLASFRQAMRELAAGVVVVTTFVDSREWGITVSACCSVSLEPPLLLVSLASSSVATTAITNSGAFGVSLLREEHESVARYGARKGSPKFIAELCEPAPRQPESRTPAIRDALAHIDCQLAQAIIAGDHHILVGRVRAVCLSEPGGAPLIYHSRRFRRLNPSQSTAEIHLWGW
jgi:flavin reductase ActVB